MSKNTSLLLPEMSGDIDLSIVIVSYNTREMTIECVQSLLNYKGTLCLQIIVVDNCSNDNSASALRDRFPGITVIDSPQNGGFAFGNNIGFEQARGRYILLLNPDTRLHTGGLPTAVKHMNDNPKVGILGPKVLLDNGVQQSSMIHFLSLTQLFFIIFIPSLWMRKTSWFGDLRYAALSRDEINDIDVVAGCFMLARRELFDQIGGLDERFFMYGEESEWCHRARQAGWIVRYNPEIQILHHGAASTAHMSEWKSVEMTKGQILFLRFTRGRYVAWLGTLLQFLRDVVRIPWHIGKAVTGGFRLSHTGKAWWARIQFLAKSLCSLPDGQTINRPSPEEILENHTR